MVKKWIFCPTLAITPTNNDHIKGIFDAVANGTMENTCNVAEPYNTTSFVMLVKNGKTSGSVQHLMLSYTCFFSCVHLYWGHYHFYTAWDFVVYSAPSRAFVSSSCCVSAMTRILPSIFLTCIRKKKLETRPYIYLCLLLCWWRKEKLNVGSGFNLNNYISRHAWLSAHVVLYTCISLFVFICTCLNLLLNVVSFCTKQWIFWHVSVLLFVT